GRERRLAQLIDGLVQETGGDERLPALSGRPGPTEPADGARLDRLLGLYTLPSYRDGQDTAVPVAGDPAPDPDPFTQALDWRPIGSQKDLDYWIGAELADRNRRFPEWGDLGAIYLGTHGKGTIMGERTQGSRLVINDLPLEGLRAPGLNEARRATATPLVELPPDAHYRLRSLAPATADGRAKFVREYYEPGLTRLLREHARRPSTMSSADFDAQVTQR